jgi:hypothetical protein
MTAPNEYRFGRVRQLMSKVIRSRDAEFIAADLEDLYVRDRARGLSSLHAHTRYAHRVIDSAFQVWHSRHRANRSRGQDWRAAMRGGSMFQDLRFGLRLLRKHWPPVAMAIGGLAVSLGVVASVFSVVDASMLRPYGMDDPSTVFTVTPVVDGRDRPEWAYRSFLRMREGATLSRVEASRPDSVGFSAVPTAESAVSRRALFVSDGYLDVLGGHPVLGRSLQPADAAPGAPPVIVISHRLWSTLLNADPATVGRTFY